MLTKPPYNLEAEQSVLGSIILDNECFPLIIDQIKKESFYAEQHKIIFESMLNLQQKNEPIDIITVTNALKAKGHLEAVGGSYYLTQVIGSVPTASSVKHYVEIVKNKSTLRATIKTLDAISTRCYEDFDDPKEILSNALMSISDIANSTIKNEFLNAQAVINIVMGKVESTYDKSNNALGIPSGFADLDALITGFMPGDLIILAARPSMGKTAFALELAQRIARKNHVGIFSMEMQSDALGFRLVSSLAEINSHRLKNGGIFDHEWAKLAKATGIFAELKLHIDDTSNINSLELKAKSVRLQKEHGLDILFIDFLQLLTSLNTYKGNKNLEVGEITKNIKQIARELNIPIVLLSQLSRNVEQRQSKIPQLSDLRDSGEIEQVADLVLFIHSEQKEDDYREIIVAKQRNGDIGSIYLNWIKQYTKFTEYRKNENCGRR